MLAASGPGGGRAAAVCALFLALFLAPCLALSAPAPSAGEEKLKEEIQKLAAADAREQRTIAASLASRDDLTLLPLLEALREGSLYVWSPPGGAKTVVIGGDAVQREGKKHVPLYSAHGREPLRTREGGALAAPEEELQEIQADRALRRDLSRFIQDLRSRAQLLAPDANVRRAAATRLARTGNPSLLPVLRKALDRETAWLSRHAVEEAISILQMGGREPAERRAAVLRLGEIRSLNALQDLKQLQTGDPDPAVRQAAVQAVKAIESYKGFISVVDTLFHGLSLGSILLLMALGLAIIFGLMGVINMAHGELMMLGAYATFVVQGLFIAYLPRSLFDFYFLAALPAAFAAAALMGFLMEVSIIRHLYGRPLETLLTTWGISLILQQAVRQTFGAANVDVQAPSWLSGGVHVMVGVQFPLNRLFIIFLTAVCVGGIYAFLFRSRAGLRIRAVTQNREMSTCLGVPSRRVDARTFALGAGLAGLAGSALSQVGNVGPDLGQNYIVDSFLVVVTGGVGKLLGTIIAGLGIGELNKALEPAMGAVFGKVAILLLIILFLQRRPEGLFAYRSRGA